MIAKRDEIVGYLSEYLKAKDFEDYCHNGLQIEGKENISKIVTGVTLSMRLIREALKKKAEMIVAHHGIFTRDIPSPLQFKGLHKERIKSMLLNDMNLVGYHLPLDAHPVIGNNISLCKLFGLKKCKPFYIGFVGELNGNNNIFNFQKIVDSKLGVKSYLLSCGKKKIKYVGIVSGGSSPHFEQAIENGADLLIGGDVREEVVRKLEEANFNYINAGHYNTEKLGIQNLGKLIEKKFKIKAEFVDIPCEI